MVVSGALKGLETPKLMMSHYSTIPGMTSNMAILSLVTAHLIAMLQANAVALPQDNAEASPGGNDLSLLQAWYVTDLYKCKSIPGAQRVRELSRLIECSKKDYLYVCSETEGKCRYRCPLGQPSRLEGHICTDVCPEGFHVERKTNLEICVRHKACSFDQVTILKGTTWHDTVCKIRSVFHSDKKTVTGPSSVGNEVNIMDDVTRLWIRALPEMVVKGLCAKQNATSDLCWHNYESHWGFQGTEQLYIELFNSGFEEYAKDLYRDVIERFLKHSIIYVNLPSPWWTQDAREVLIPAYLTTMVGMLSEHQVENLNMTWAAKGHDGTKVTLIHVNRGVLQLPVISTCSLGGEKDAFKLRRGYTEDSVYLPLIIRDFNCLGQRSLDLTLKLESKLTGDEVILKKDIPVNCHWKPAISEQCDCAQALRDYINPLGPCSPACLTGTESLSTQPGWTLTVSRDPPDPASLRTGRSLYGSSSPSTERFCLVNEFVFDSYHSPAHSSPVAPFDIQNCDTTLIEVAVLTKITASILSMTDGNKSGDESRYPRNLYISRNATRTIATAIRQKWPARLGIKFHFDATPTRRQIISVFNWMLQLNRLGGGENARFHVAVVEMAVKEISNWDFEFLQFMYGSEFEIIPALRASDLAEFLRISKRMPRGGRTVTQSEASQAEALLKRLGEVVAKHGLFLDTDTMGIFAPELSQSNNCHNIIPGRWTLGPKAALSLIVASVEVYPERTGVMLFEEMCMRSNNRAGIVLTMPTARYRQVKCSSITFFNRHTHKGPNDLVYTHAELDDIAQDMSKWGVRRYSLGYLDHTYGMSDTGGKSTFKLVSESILSHAHHRKLHYVYTETSGDGYALYPLTKVYGVYKLDAGIFFQLSDAGPRTKGFVPVAKCEPEIRLGLASEMNLGAEQREVGAAVSDPIDAVHEIPFGVCAVPLDNLGSLPSICARHFDRPLAFVRHDGENISVFFTDEKRGQRNLRFSALGTMLGAHNGELWPGEVDAGSNCYSYVSRAKHTTKLTIAYPTQMDALVGWLLDLRGPQLCGLDVQQDVPLTSSHNDWNAGLGHFELELELYVLLSHAAACLKGSQFCLALADYANSWPQGGLGIPVDIETENSNTTITFDVYHGATRFRVPCNLKPFTLGSVSPTVPFTHHPIFTDNGIGAAVSHFKQMIVEVQRDAQNVLYSLDKLHCGGKPAPPQQLSNRALNRVEKCLGLVATNILRLEKDLIQPAIDTNSSGEMISPAMATLAARIYGISVTSFILTVLINSASAVLLYFTQRNLYRAPWYNKFK